MGNLRLVDWNDHSQDSDADACDETTDVEHCDHNSGSLNDAADNEDATRCEYSTAAAKSI